MKLRSSSKKESTFKKDLKTAETNIQELLKKSSLQKDLKNYRPPRKCNINNFFSSFDKHIDKYTNNNIYSYCSKSYLEMETKRFDRYFKRITSCLFLDRSNVNLSNLGLREHAERVSTCFSILTHLQTSSSKFLDQVSKNFKENEAQEKKLASLMCFLEINKNGKKDYFKSSSAQVYDQSFIREWTKHSAKLAKIFNSLTKIKTQNESTQNLAYRYASVTTNISVVVSSAASDLHERFTRAMQEHGENGYGKIPEKGSDEYNKRVKIINENLIDQKEDKEETCTICLGSLVINNGDDADSEQPVCTKISSMKSCTHHKFHFECIQEWLVQKANCPVCRKNLRPKNTEAVQSNANRRIQHPRMVSSRPASRTTGARRLTENSTSNSHYPNARRRVHNQMPPNAFRRDHDQMLLLNREIITSIANRGEEQSADNSDSSEDLRLYEFMMEQAVVRLNPEL